MTKNIVGRLAGRFLTWKLPADFNPDGGVTFTPEYQNPSGPAKHEPTGTNLLTYAQAVTMVEHMLADLIESLSPPDGVGLPFERDTLGRMVREAWVRWAQTQPNPKPSFLAPYDDLSEADKEADRQIGEAIAKWTMIGVSAQANSPAASPPDGVGLTRYMWTPHGLSRDVVGPPETHWVRYEDAGAALAAEQMAYQSVKNALHAAEKREAAYLARGDEWQAVAEKAGVCMACALGAHEPYGCTDCLNTGWAQGAPPGYVDEAALAAEKARGDGPEDGGLGDPDDWGADGAKWAAAFHETAIRLGYSDMDEGWLIGWFANAIERGRVAHPDTKRERATIAERDRRIADLEAGFSLARNRLQRAVVDHPTGSEPFYRLSEWADDAARALLSGQQASEGRDG